MSLRSRLWSVFIVLTLLPLLVGGVIAIIVVPRLQAGQARTETSSGAAAVREEIASRCRAVGIAGRITALNAADSTDLQRAAASEVPRTVDYAAILNRSGAVLAERGARPAGLGDLRAVQTCSQGAPAAPILLERVALSGPAIPAGDVVVAAVLDPAALGAHSATRQVALLQGRRVIASTSPERDPVFAALVANARGASVESGSLIGSALEPAPGVPWTVLVVEDRPDAGALQRWIALACVVAVVLALAMGWWIARSLTQPLDELAAVAERVARGELDVAVPVRSGEVGRLGERFRDMTRELRQTISDLERSRAEMGASLQRLGETLSHTLDLDALLATVLETAVTLTGATAGAALALDGDGFGLVAEHDFERIGRASLERVIPGVGLLGVVASRAVTLRGRIGADPGELVPGAGEPASGHLLATPLRRGTQVIGLLALYRPPDWSAFSPETEANLLTLAGQASIAVDNVLMHREAQRLSITDALTGLWNFRYLSMSLAREIERASRFDRPLAVLMLDLDRFKAVNDTYGHACGDAVLREVADRVSEQVREVDTFARYGGEEFVLVLPETTVEGATMLAERICAAVRRDPFVAGERPLAVTISIGVAAFPGHGGSPATLMRAADEALYRAKNSGRDGWCLAAAPDETGGSAPAVAARLTAPAQDLG